MAALERLLEAVAKDFLAAKGLGYHIWERELPVNLGSAQRWIVTSTDGRRFALTGEHLEVIRQMDDWVLSGRGKNPAASWDQARRQHATALPTEVKARGASHKH